MKYYLIRIFIFIALGILIGEAGIRVFDLAVDIPEVYMDGDHLIKFKPNQTGRSVQRCKWIINQYGNYGPAPRSLDSLITVIGNSYISNTMNPPECHQANWLTSLNQDYNFYPMSRDGASFIEFMEMTRSLDHLNPIKQLVYVHNEDFTYSVFEQTSQPGAVQYSMDKDEIRYVELENSKLKKLLYRFQLAYFIYRNFFVLADQQLFDAKETTTSKELSLNYDTLGRLFSYTKDHYKVSNVLLVFFPDSDPQLVDMAVQAGFETMLLETDDYRSWLTSENGHWSCYGHEQVARQVDNYLRQHMQNEKQTF